MRRLRLRYPAACGVCGAALPARTEALWDSEAKKAMCLACLGVDVPERSRGEAGASALARADELEARSIARAARRWGADAALVAAAVVHDDPSIRAWKKGGDGESRLGAFIEREVGDAVISLHDRIIPGTRAANIDHLVVAPGGVWVVDAKTYKGKVEKRDAGPFWRQELRLYVDGRDRTKLVEGMRLQLKAVHAALANDPAHGEIPVRAALCFLDSEWNLFARPFVVGGVTVLYPEALRDRLEKPGPFAREAIERIAGRLARSLPSARG